MIPPPPRVEPLGGNRYRLVEDYVYAWKKEGVHAMLVVPAGFECDLASVPRILWWYISPFDLGSAVVPHDWIYEHRGHLPAGSHLRLEEGIWVDVGLPWSRRDADRLFGRMMREANLRKRKRRRAYKAVRLFGWRAWRRR
jgi:hypothetical protein